MQAWLLLVDGEQGLAHSVDMFPSAGPAATNEAQLQVDSVRLNEQSAGEAAVSVQAGGNLALKLLHRAFKGKWRPISVESLEVRTQLSAGDIRGRSGDLLFAMLSFIKLAQRDGLFKLPSHGFAATGQVDTDGNVIGVEDVLAKIEAALRELPAGSVVIYPEANKSEVSQELHDRAWNIKEIRLKAVERVEEALGHLGITVKGWWKDSPYRALDTYKVQDSPIYFGREQQIQEFLAMLLEREKRPLNDKPSRPGGMVVAASGAGKSSFVQAGLLAEMRTLPAPEHPPLEYAIWRPSLVLSDGLQLIEEGEVACSVLMNWATDKGEQSTGFIGMKLVQMPASLLALAQALEQTGLSQRRLVWVVDQLEELFNLPFSNEARIAFARFLGQLQELGVWVVASMRNEYLDEYMNFGVVERGSALLVDVFQTAFLLPMMAEGALYQVIRGPADVAGVRFAKRETDGLDLDEVLRAAALDAKSMPLLGCALNKLWEKRRQPPEDDSKGSRAPVMTFDAYEEIGGSDEDGIKVVIGRAAEKVYASEEISDIARAELPRLLEALAVPMDDETQESGRPADLRLWRKGTPGRELIEALVAARLLITEQGTNGTSGQVRVIHDALFKHWDRARKELKKSRDTRTQIKLLVARHNEWAMHGEPPDELLTSAADLVLAEAARPDLARRSELSKVLRFVDLSLTERARKQRLIDEERQRDKRRVRVFSLLIVLLALAVAAAGYFTLKASASAKAVEKSKRAEKAGTQRTNAAMADAMVATEAASAAAARAELASVSERRQAALASFENSNRIARESAALLEAGDFDASLLMALYADPEARQVSSEFAPKIGNAFARARLEAAFESMRYTKVLGENKAAVSAIAFSPDGSQLVTAEGEIGPNEPSVISFFDARTLKEIRTIPGPRGGVRSLTYSPKGNLIAFGAHYSSTSEGLSVYDAKSRTRINLEEDRFASAPSAMSFSDDETMLAYSLPTTQIAILELQKQGNSFRQNRTLIGGCEATAIAFIPSNEKLVAACEDRKLSIWTSISRSKLKFDPDVFATQTDFADTISINGLEQAAKDLFVLKDGKSIAGAVGKSVVVWSLENREEMARFTMSEPISQFVFDSNQRLLALASANFVEVRDLQTRTSARLRGHKQGSIITALAISRTGTYLVSAATDRTVRVWQRYGGEMTFRLRGAAVPKTSVAFSSDGYFLSSTDDFTGGEVWDVNSGSVSFRSRLGKIPESRFLHRRSETSAISPDGTASASASGANIEISIGSGNNVVKVLLTGHKSEVRSVSFSPDGRLVASASGDPENSIFIWDSRAGQLIATLVGHEYMVNSVAFSPDGSRIASASSDLTVGVWDVPKFLRQTTSEQVKAACQRLQDVRAPLAFSVSDISRFPFLQGKPIDPSNPKVLLSPCKGLISPP